MKPAATLRVAHITTVDMSLRHLLLNQLCHLQQVGYEVTGISAPGVDVSAIEAAGIRYVPVALTRNVTPVADLVALWHLYRIFRQENFAIVHVHTAKAELLGTVAARLAAVPVIIDTFRGIYFRKGMHSLWRHLFVLMARIAARCSDAVLAQSRSILEMAVAEGICPRDKIEWLGNGIDIKRFDRTSLDTEKVERLRIELGIRPEERVVGFVGRLVAEKGIRELLQAARIIHQQMLNIRLLFVGPVDYEKPDALMPDVAGEYDLEDVCCFAGMRHDMPEMYALMDVFVLPSQRESFPRAPMEAAAMGVPCVVTDVPGCREAIEPGGNGFLVPLGDIEALTDSILSLLSDRDMAMQMGAEGRRLARERFDERLVFEKVKDMYAHLLIEKGLTPPARCEEEA